MFEGLLVTNIAIIKAKKKKEKECRCTETTLIHTRLYDSEIISKDFEAM